MRYKILLLLCCCSSLIAAPKVALHLRAEPTAISRITKVYTALGQTRAAIAEKVSALDVFITLDESNTPQPIIFLRGLSNAASAELLFPKIIFSQHKSGWWIGTPSGDLPSEEDFNYLVSLPLTRADISLRAWPTAIVDAIKFDPSTAAKLGGKPQRLALEELAALDTFEIRASLDTDPSRLIFIARAKAGSNLADLFSQKLPNALPPEHERISVLGEAAYGYLQFNPSAVATYLQQLYDRSISAEVSGLNPPDQLIWPPSRGYCVLTIGADGHFKKFYQGRWQREQVPPIIRQELQYMAAGDPSITAPAVRNAFIIGNTPVWRALKRDSITIVPQDTLFFTALNDGNILQAPTAESISSFIEDISSPAVDGSTPTLARSFVQLPTLCAQFKLHPGRVLQALNERFPFGAELLPRELPDTPIYIGASMGKGQLAITLDIPQDTLSALQQYHQQISPAQVEQQPAPTPAPPPTPTEAGMPLLDE
jgi:hypothetical protein